MDIATLIGFVGTFGLILMAMGDPSPFVDMPSVYIVLGGTTTAVLARSSIPDLIGAIGTGLKTVLGKVDDPGKLIEQLVELGTIARKDGMIALEGQDIKNNFLAKGIRMLVDGTDGALVKKAMEVEKTNIENRHAVALSVFTSAKEIAPAMGMIGTLVGLVLMLGNMSDPKSIGPAMAVALLTTMYGAIVANVLCIPLIQKLEQLDFKEKCNNELIIEAVMFIQSGGNPRLRPDVLMGYVAPKKRAAVKTE